MKNLIFINGTMGVGKTETSKELQRLLPRCVFLDGDWCWDASPFVVTDETKEMVIDNITYLLNNFISCSEYENIIFCWEMHEQSILNDVLSRLSIHDYVLYKFSVVCSEQALVSRLVKDIEQSIRTEDIIKRSVERCSAKERLCESETIIRHFRFWSRIILFLSLAIFLRRWSIE